MNCSFCHIIDLTFHFYSVFKLHFHNFATWKTKYQNIQFTNCPCWCSDYCYLQQTIVILEPQTKVFVWLRSFNMPLPHMMHTLCVKQAKHTTNNCCRNTMRRITTLQHPQVLLCYTCQVFIELSELQFLLQLYMITIYRIMMKANSRFFIMNFCYKSKDAPHN